MLEQKIDDLTIAVKQLNETIWQLIDSLPGKLNVDELVEPAPIKADKPNPPEIVVPTISRDDVQDLCMTLVRADRSLKNTVRDIIAEFDGAATLKDVAEKDLSTLKAKLEALR